MVMKNCAIDNLIDINKYYLEGDGEIVLIYGTLSLMFGVYLTEAVFSQTFMSLNSYSHILSPQSANSPYICLSLRVRISVVKTPSAKFNGRVVIT